MAETLNGCQLWRRHFFFRFLHAEVVLNWVNFLVLVLDSFAASNVFHLLAERNNSWFLHPNLLLIFVFKVSVQAASPRNVLFPYPVAVAMLLFYLHVTEADFSKISKKSIRSVVIWAVVALNLAVLIKQGPTPSLLYIFLNGSFSIKRNSGRFFNNPKAPRGQFSGCHRNQSFD